jgi:hypothetical protein
VANRHLRTKIGIRRDHRREPVAALQYDSQGAISANCDEIAIAGALELA